LRGGWRLSKLVAELVCSRRGAKLPVSHPGGLFSFVFPTRQNRLEYPCGSGATSAEVLMELMDERLGGWLASTLGGWGLIELRYLHHRMHMIALHAAAACRPRAQSNGHCRSYGASVTNPAGIRRQCACAHGFNGTLSHAKRVQARVHISLTHARERG
jgi:hypothetical protein